MSAFSINSFSIFSLWDNVSLMAHLDSQPPKVILQCWNTYCICPIFMTNLKPSQRRHVLVLAYLKAHWIAKKRGSQVVTQHSYLEYWCLCSENWKVDLMYQQSRIFAFLKQNQKMCEWLWSILTSKVNTKMNIFRNNYIIIHVVEN